MSIYSVLETQNIIPSTNTTGDYKTKEEQAAEEVEQQKTDFLQLLLTQLSNQNPLDPMDTDEWTAQLTRYSILEQGIETNANLSITNDLLKSSATTASFDYIGETVEIATNVSAIQDGSATWSYVIDGSPSEVFITLTDAQGNKIIEEEGSIAVGVQTFTLNAADYNLPEGQPIYMSINAKDGDGNSLSGAMTTQIKVDGLWTDGSENYLTAGEMSFRTTDVAKIIN